MKKDNKKRTKEMVYRFEDTKRKDKEKREKGLVMRAAHFNSCVKSFFFIVFLSLSVLLHHV